jgi:sterol desaturase/sphingolipid hydroxylase (fatty acid hydroxylase superfamily)
MGDMSATASGIAGVLHPDTEPAGTKVVGRMPTWVAFLLLAGCAASIASLLSWQWISEGLRTTCDGVIGSSLGERTCGAGVSKILIYSWVLAMLPAMLLLERLIPANPDQPAFSPGMLVDIMWFLTFPVLGAWLPNLFDGFLHSTFGGILEGFRLKALAALPLAIQLVLVIVVADFLAWFGHLVRHKSSLLWKFHQIHHSQVQLNYFSTRRVHPLDTVAQSLIRFLPWTLLGLTVALPGYLIWNTFLRLYEMFVHSNLRLNLGPLKYVLVTPQSHRIHHSLYERHVDTNFGDFLSIWDYMFGTQVKEYDIYPPLGIANRDCPEGVATTTTGAIATFFRELLYPLKAVVGAGRKSGAAEAPRHVQHQSE